jgi:hypothetical protein
MRRALPLLALLALVLVPVAAQAHPERPTKFPEYKVAGPPKYRTTGPALVVCQKDSRARLKQLYKGKGKKTRRTLKRKLALLKKCRFSEIQPAVNAAKSGYRILIMPGVYTEPSARKVPFGEYQKEPCPNDYAVTEGFDQPPPPAGPTSNDPPIRPDRNMHLKCPNAKNLIAVVGDARPETDSTAPLEPECNRLCNLQIEGYGKTYKDVVISSDRVKTDVMRIDRAYGIYLRRFTIENGAFNGIDIVETDGFQVKDIEARFNQNYGILSFTATNGLYDRIDAHHNGDSGVYPGSGMKGCALQNHDVYGTCQELGCQRSTTEIRNVYSHHNVLGYSGTAANSTYVHDSTFSDNASGLTTDSFASGHPGMPQECFRWERNKIHSNNFNPFSAENQQKCAAGGTVFRDRPQELVCPQFQTAVGTGVLVAGGNRNLLRDNWIYDNWRWGAAQLGVPASVRDDNDPEHQSDTSNGNRYVDNRMGVRPDGTRDPNGVDFWWDEQGVGNCWTGNVTAGGGAVKSDPNALPGCSNPSSNPANQPLKLGRQVPCTAWDPQSNPRPVGCDWFDVGPEPQ